MILYNKTIAKKELNKVKKDSKETAKSIQKEIKQVETGLKFLNFQIELHEEYGDEYTFNQREKDNMLEILTMFLICILFIVIIYSSEY